MIVEKDVIVFETTDKCGYANRGIIGIKSDLETFGGYDGPFPGYGHELTKEERVELADHMIALWTRYKNDAVEKE